MRESVSMTEEREERGVRSRREKKGGEEKAYILSTGCVCGFYLREDVAEVFGQLLCAGGVDWHCLFFLC